MALYTTIHGKTSAEIEAKKSRFIANLAHVSTEKEALAFLESVRAENRMARHNVYAYILHGATSGQRTGRTRYSDDGEPQKTAGLPTLEVLKGANLSDVICVTTRYFGGVLLGTGGLVRAYTQAVQAAIASAQLLEISKCVDVRVKTAYANFGKLEHLASTCGAKQQECTYAADISATYRMLAGSEVAFLKGLQALERGSENVEVSKPFESAF